MANVFLEKSISFKCDFPPHFQLFYKSIQFIVFFLLSGSQLEAFIILPYGWTSSTRAENRNCIIDVDLENELKT